MRRVTILALTLAASLSAERYALLVGAGEFPNAPKISSLAGPANDVEALRQELVRNWSVAAPNITALVNATSTREAILAELTRIAAKAKSGDVVIFYYSGHGTSAHDRATAGFGMDLGTGAIVPANLRQSKDAQEILGQLIVGARDLRPSLQKLDNNNVQVLVLFDACYSGDSAKSIHTLTPRNADLLSDIVAAPSALASFQDALKRDSSAPSEWPYRNVIYISASARHEMAWDISAAMARTQRPTLDGMAHGAFTNALLAGLRGAADTDHDRQISYAELHGYLVRELQNQGQTPQLHPRDREIVRKGVMGSQTAPAPPAEPAAAPVSEPLPLAAPLRIRIAEREPAMHTTLATIDGVKIVDGAYDLEVTGADPRYRLMHSGGTPVTEGALRRADVVSLIARRARAHRLVARSFPRQDFNINLALTPDQGAYYPGERAQVQVQPERKCWLLIISVDVKGSVYVLFPHKPADVRAILAGENVTAVEIEAVPPLGTEIIQVFGFVDKPEGYDGLAGTVKLSEQEVESLAAAIEREAASPGRSQVRRITFTAKR